MVKTKKSLVAKKPKVVGVEILKKNGLNVGFQTFKSINNTFSCFFRFG